MTLVAVCTGYCRQRKLTVAIFTHPNVIYMYIRAYAKYIFFIMVKMLSTPANNGWSDEEGIWISTPGRES